VAGLFKQPRWFEVADLFKQLTWSNVDACSGDILRSPQNRCAKGGHFSAVTHGHVWKANRSTVDVSLFNVGLTDYSSFHTHEMD
jgi:hypothetical protein